MSARLRVRDAIPLGLTIPSVLLGCTYVTDVVLLRHAMSLGTSTTRALGTVPAGLMLHVRCRGAQVQPLICYWIWA